MSILQNQEIIDLFKKGISISAISRKVKKDKRIIKKILLNAHLDIGNLKNTLTPCKYCGSTTNLHIDKRGGILPVCSKGGTCYEKYQNEKNQKRKETTLSTYGVSYITQLTATKKKIRETCLKKYGTENPLKNKEVKKKAEDTLEKNYGTRVPSQNKEIQNKIKQTNLEKYGFENARQNETVKKKAEKTTLERFGVDNIFKSKKFQEDLRSRNVEKYGTEFYTQTEEMKNKSKKTMLKKHGVEYFSQSESIKIKVWKTYRSNYWNTFNTVLKNKYIKPLFSKQDYIDLSRIISLEYKCLRCNTILKFEFLNPHRIHCSCTAHRSYFEDDIITWVQSLGIVNIKPNEKYYENGKLKFEIDVYLPDYNLGIDFNGIYWHSDLYRSRSYHQSKYKYFKEKNIQLIQIFESEWVNKESIVKSILLNKLGVNTKIFARKCSIREVDSASGKKFLEQNHLQSSSSAGIRIGLYYNEELVCLGAFGKFRYKNEDAYEIIRFAGKLGHTIVGGFERILKYFETTYKPKKIISFVDVRYFTGNSYKNFINTDLTQPNYFYFKDKDKTLTLWSRIKFQKHKLKDKLEMFDPDLSEYENMLTNGYLRIFDAGNLRMIKNF